MGTKPGILLGVLLLLCAPVGATANNVQIDLGIVAAPTDVLIEPDASATLAVLLKGPVKSIQWQKNGTDIPGATNPFLEVKITESKPIPDAFSVQVRDAFGKSIRSTEAKVLVLPSNSELILREKRRLSSIKLQSLFNVVHLFDQASTLVSEPLQEWGDAPSKLHYYFDQCPDDVQAELVHPVRTSDSDHQALKLELKNCRVSRLNSVGDQTGPLVDGLLIQSRKVENLDKATVVTEEKLARNLVLRFPNAKLSIESDTVDFDLAINGKLTKKTETIQTPDQRSRIREEWHWTKGTEFTNPQTGVNAKILSGSVIKERFGKVSGRELRSSRETEIFNQLKLKIGADEVTISGMVTKIFDNDFIIRNGLFNIAVNGKRILSTPSEISTTGDLSGDIPWVPKLNGFFMNDHSPTAQPSLKLVLPTQAPVARVN